MFTGFYDIKNRPINDGDLVLVPIVKDRLCRVKFSQKYNCFMLYSNDESYFFSEVYDYERVSA